jgi:hypothetical protein
MPQKRRQTVEASQAESSTVMANYSKCGAFTQGKGWRRTIGQKVGNGGRLMPCRFWLGMDKPKATATALSIESLWVRLNNPYWSADALAEAEAVRVGATAKNATESAADVLGKATARARHQTVLTFGGLIDRYRQAKLNEASISDASKHSIRCRTKSLEQSPMASTPMASIGAEQLASLVSHWLACPLNGKGEQISSCSARLIVKTARAVFDYADSVGLWLAPRRFERIFRLPRASASPTIEIYSMDDLKALWGQANQAMRLLMLLGLNCGFCSMELATLKRSEIDLNAKVILNWMLQGLKAWFADGRKLNEPREVSQAVGEYRNDSDTFGSFLADCIENNDASKVAVSTAFSIYGSWVDENRLTFKLNKIEFGKWMAERGYSSKPSNGVRYFVGCSFKQDDTTADDTADDATAKPTADAVGKVTYDEWVQGADARAKADADAVNDDRKF